MAGRAAMTGRASLGILAVVVVFVGLLVVAEAVPDDRVERQLAAAIEDGQYGPALVPDRFGGFHDGFTECVVLGQGLGSPPEQMGPWRRAIYAPRIGSCEQGVDQIATLASGGEVEAGPYHRYWNGYAPVTRPVVAAVGVTGLRVVVGVLLAGAAAFAAIAVGRRLGWPATVALFAPVVLASNVVTTPAHGFTHAISLSVAAAGTGLVAVAADRGRLATVAATSLAAALFVYVDLLTTPAVPWVLAAFVAAAVAARRGASTAEVARTTAIVGVVWPVVYAATWAVRWLLAAAVLGPDVLGEIVEISRFRVGGAFEGVQEHVGAATRTNLEWWLGRTPTAPVVLGLAVATCVVALVIAGRHDRTRPALAALLAVPALVVPAWYELLSNHSQIHAFFTYRSVPVAVGVGTAACVMAATRPERPAAERPG